jgi:hypothetical protein
MGKYREVIVMSNKKKNSEKRMSPTEKRRMIYEIQTLGKKLLAQNGGRDIPFTCVDGRGKELISGRN